MKPRTASGIVSAFSPQSSDPDSWCAADNFIPVTGSQKQKFDLAASFQAETATFTSFMFSDVSVIIYFKQCILKQAGAVRQCLSQKFPSARNSRAWVPKRLCFMAAWALLRAFLVAGPCVLSSWLGNSVWIGFCHNIGTRTTAFSPKETGEEGTYTIFLLSTAIYFHRKLLGAFLCLKTLGSFFQIGQNHLEKKGKPDRWC